mgnify:CR=1 FL=1
MSAACSALRADDASALVAALTGIGPSDLHNVQLREDCTNMALRLGNNAPAALRRAAHDCASGDSILHVACAQGAHMCAAQLIDRFGFDPSGRAPSDGATPLHLAAFAGRRKLVEALLRRGADANARSLGADPNAIRMRDGPRPPVCADATPLHYACLGVRTSRSEAVEALLKGGASPHRRDEHGSTPLHVCCHRGVEGAALALLKAASDKPLTDLSEGASASDRDTAYASRRDYVERFSPLHRLVGCAQPPDFDPAPLVPDLVAGGADPDAYSRRGLAPAHVAAERGKARAVARAEHHAAALTLAALAAHAALAASAGAAALAAVADAPRTKSPAFLGFACVAVRWGIPQTLGTAILSQKEAKGRALLQKRGIDTSDIGQGNWGKVQRRLQENDIDWKNEEA